MNKNRGRNLLVGISVATVSPWALWSSAQNPAVVDLTPGRALEALGAEMESGVSREQFEAYGGHFDRVDSDRDGTHSESEFIDNGGYLSPAARRGIFAAADRDGDRVVTRAEYILNRIITDEAKEIVQARDADGDGLVDRDEFVEGLPGGGPEFAAGVFGALDSDGDGEIPIPEYLRVWGEWARDGRPAAEARIATLTSRLEGGGKAGAAPERPEGGRRPAGSPPASGRGILAMVLMRFDRDGDGQLSSGELMLFLKEADRDGNGSLDAGELGAFGPPGRRPPEPEKSPRRPREPTE